MSLPRLCPEVSEGLFLSVLSIDALFSKVVFSDLSTGAIFSKVDISNLSTRAMISKVVFLDLLKGAVLSWGQPKQFYLNKFRLDRRTYL